MLTSMWIVLILGIDSFAISILSCLIPSKPSNRSREFAVGFVGSQEGLGQADLRTSAPIDPDVSAAVIGGIGSFRTSQAFVHKDIKR